MATSLGSSATSSRPASDAPPANESGIEPRTPVESGIPPGGRRYPGAASLAAHGEAHVLAALSAGARTDAGLGALFRAIQHASASISGAREANAELTHELEILRDLLSTSNEQQVVLERQLRELSQKLARAEQEAARDRAFLIEEQDAFIVSLCGDHEREVAELWQRLSESRNEATRTETALRAAVRDDEAEQHKQDLARAEARVTALEQERDQARATLVRLQAQRDEAQSALVRIASERDQALMELSRSNSPPSSRAAGSVRTPSSDATPIASVRTASRPNLAPVEPEQRIRTVTPPPLPVGAGGTAPPSSSAIRTRVESVTPPEELAAALTPAPARIASRPVIAVKPDPGTRPLIGYSMGKDEIEAEHIEGANVSSRPPSTR